MTESRTTRTFREKETYKYLGILEADTIKQMEMKEKRIPQENKKITRNQTMWQNSHQRDKHLGCPSRGIHQTILKVDERRTFTNRPENKKIHYDA